MDGFCRGCLVHEDPTNLLQYTEGNRRLFVYSTGLQVKRNDTFTFQLCKDCYMCMKQACRFKKTCRNTDRKFKQYIAAKEIGDDTSFHTFIKNNDDFMKFPCLSGNATPVYQKHRDEDNESTCTSIRNFMSEMVRGDDIVDEIQDAEARIIREVIEEEADVLDDSLDSHWLRDDVSIDTDFRLDFNFSGFSTPRSVHERNHDYTPQKFDTSSQEQDKIKSFAREIMQDCERLTKNKENEKPLDNFDTNQDVTLDEDFNDVVEQADFQTEIVNHDFEMRGKFYIEQLNKPEPFDHIDRNIEIALKDGNRNEEYFIHDIIKTPEIQPGVSTMSTPTINNILFGDGVNIDLTVRKSPKHDESTSNTDILNDFFKPKTPAKDIDGEIETGEFDIEDDEDYNLKDHNLKEQNLKEQNLKDRNLKNHNLKANNLVTDKTIVDDRCDLETSFCKLCKKKFFNEKSLRLHFMRFHNDPIKIPAEKSDGKRKRICEKCGKELHCDRSGYYRHRKRCLKQPDTEEERTCKICFLVFKNAKKLKYHITCVHENKRPKKEKTKFVCSICGVYLQTKQSLTIHMHRHEKNYTHECDHCGKGFYRRGDLELHMRHHTGERPEKCSFCKLSFHKRTILNTHIKLVHTDARKYKCAKCSWKFASAKRLDDHLKKKEVCRNFKLKTLSHLLEKDGQFCAIINTELLDAPIEEIIKNKEKYIVNKQLKVVLNDIMLAKDRSNVSPKGELATKVKETSKRRKLASKAIEVDKSNKEVWSNVLDNNIMTTKSQEDNLSIKDIDISFLLEDNESRTNQECVLNDEENEDLIDVLQEDITNHMNQVMLKITTTKGSKDVLNHREDNFKALDKVYVNNEQECMEVDVDYTEENAFQNITNNKDMPDLNDDPLDLLNED